MSFPYKEWVAKYRGKGWFGTLPLPRGKKEAPPEGWHGKKAQYPDREKVIVWIADEKWAEGNICLRLAKVPGQEYEVIGIDVDHYESGGKDKKGWDQLQALESELGVLPQTWISSSRCDGKSGIRFFVVPRGLAFRGKAAKDIDVISKGNRYAVVYPSIHPNGEIYLWFKGTPDSDHIRDEIPHITNIPRLPDAWVDFLTAGRTEFTLEELDLDSSVDEIYEWAGETFFKPNELCYRMMEKVELHKKAIEGDPSSHDKIINAHWNLISLAAEGHFGVLQAINEIERYYSEDVIRREKRGLSALQGEIFRSRINAFRKIKAEIEARLALGAVGVPPDDPECCGATVALKPVQEYLMNDDGNGEHFVDMFTKEFGPAIRYVDGYGWIVWIEADGHVGPHWERDRDGDQMIRQMWVQVRDRQLAYVEGLKIDLENEIASAVNQGLPTGNQVATPNTLKRARALYTKWAQFAEKSGMNKNANDAIRNARSKPRIQISINDLDKNPSLIGVKNGVLELNGGKVTLRDAKPEDYITMNTNVMWKEPSKHAADLWEDYLDTFLPDLEERRIAQIAFGHCLPGGNDEKIVIVIMGDPNTGKSTMVNSIEAALGDYAVSVDHSVFQQKTFNPTLAAAVNSRMAIASEFDKEDNLSAAMIKRVSGGTDKVGTDIKFSMEKLIAVPQFVVVLSTNGFPKISGADKALGNRMLVIPFMVVPEIILKSNANKVKNTCAEAVLQFLVAGYVMYKELGYLPSSSKTKEATSDLVSNLTDIGAFLEECVEKHLHMESGTDWKFKSDWCVKTGTLYTAFERWWNQENNQPNRICSRREFALKVRELGFRQERVTIDGKQDRYWVGIKLRPFTETNIIPFKPNLN